MKIHRFFFIYNIMKNLKLFEEYYDEVGNSWQDHEIPDSAFDKPGLTYLNPELESILPELEDIKNQLRVLNNRLENVAPLDEDIEDAIDAIDRVFKKWEERPLNKTVKKYNI